MARALLGKSVGDDVTVRTPRGRETLEVIAIDYELSVD
jgi:transcription elongation GreA/GreB family factor